MRRFLELKLEVVPLHQQICDAVLESLHMLSVAIAFEAERQLESQVLLSLFVLLDLALQIGQLLNVLLVELYFEVFLLKLSS